MALATWLLKQIERPLHWQGLIETVKVSLKNPLPHRRWRSLDLLPTRAQSTLSLNISISWAFGISSIWRSWWNLFPSTGTRANNGRLMNRSDNDNTCQLPKAYLSERSTKRKTTQEASSTFLPIIWHRG
jgi:hypothetical protein